MTLRPLPSLAALTLIALPALLPAQTASSSSEEVRLEKLMADSAQWYVPRSKVSIGFRVLSNGGNVHFGNLGSVDFDIKDIAPVSAGAADRSYDNGSVGLDAARSNEKDPDTGVQTSTPGGRYTTTAATNVLDDSGNPVLNDDGTNVTQLQQSGDFLAYTPGLTRNWTYGTASQLTADGHVAMSTYSATSEGGGLSKDVGATAGVDFQFAYTFSKPTSRVQWGVTTGISLNGINAKSVGSVTATLHTRTDFYSLNGAAAPAAPYNSNAALTDFTGADGTIYTNGTETTVTLADAPDQPTKLTDTPGGATINGNWQIKGAYYMVRLGPSMHTQLTNRLNVSASAGLAGAYAGTTYSLAETFHVPDLPDSTPIGSSVGVEQTSETKFLTGYYADLNLEWMANERTGLFTGFTAQKFDGYDQSVGSRTARVDIGSSVGLRGGISIRF